MLTIFILLKLNLPPIELRVEKEEDRNEYLTAMQEADEGNYSHLERLLGQALSETLKLSQE